MRDLGVDLHTNSFTVTFRSASGRVCLRGYKLKRLSEFARDLKKTDRIAVEATGNTGYFVDKIVSRF